MPFDLNYLYAPKKPRFPEEFHGWLRGKDCEAACGPWINGLLRKWVLLNFFIDPRALEGQTQISGGLAIFISPILTIIIDIWDKISSNVRILGVFLTGDKKRRTLTRLIKEVKYLITCLPMCPRQLWSLWKTNTNL